MACAIGAAAAGPRQVGDHPPLPPHQDPGLHEHTTAALELRAGLITPEMKTEARAGAPVPAVAELAALLSPPPPKAPCTCDDGAPAQAPSPAGAALRGTQGGCDC